MDYIGKLGAGIISAATPVIVRFTDGQILEFDSEEDARGFLSFYNRSPSARTQNQAKLYLFNSGLWHQQRD